MTIEKRSENSWRVKEMYKGKYYYATFSYKPTKKEATIALAAAMKNLSDPSVKGTFEGACRDYIDSKSNILSPTTIRGYDSILRNLSDDFKKMQLCDITPKEVQREINAYMIKDDGTLRSSKTVRNASGFIATVLHDIMPNLALNTTLPQRNTSDDYMPTDDEIKKILDAARSTRYELPFMLGICSLRRSEICALTPKDLDENNVLHINKSYVQDKDNNWIIRHYNKTEESSREIHLPDKIAEEYRKIQDKRIFSGSPQTILRNLHKYQDQLGIQRFRFHTLRAYFVSYCHAEGIPDQYIMKNGGWKTDTVMKNVYRRIKSDTDKIMEQKIIDKLNNVL